MGVRRYGVEDQRRWRCGGAAAAAGDQGSRGPGGQRERHVCKYFRQVRCGCRRGQRSARPVYMRRTNMRRGDQDAIAPPDQRGTRLPPLARYLAAPHTHNTPTMASSGSSANWVSMLQALAPAPGPQPPDGLLPPEQRYGKMYPGGPILPLWVPVVLLAHAFAAYWLLQMLLLWNPSLGHRLRRRLLGGRGGGAADAAPQPAGACRSGCYAASWPAVLKRSWPVTRHPRLPARRPWRPAAARPSGGRAWGAAARRRAAPAPAVDQRRPLRHHGGRRHQVAAAGSVRQRGCACARPACLPACLPASAAAAAALSEAPAAGWSVLRLQRHPPPPPPSSLAPI
jgi:hypothetical protein